MYGLNDMPLFLTDSCLNFLNSTFWEVVRNVILPKQAQLLYAAIVHWLPSGHLPPCQVFQDTFLCNKADVRNVCPRCSTRLGLPLGRLPLFAHLEDSFFPSSCPIRHRQAGRQAGLEVCSFQNL